MFHSVSPLLSLLDELELLLLLLLKAAARKHRSRRRDMARHAFTQGNLSRLCWTDGYLVANGKVVNKVLARN
ncbi:hypothetical protein AK812_SmicGene39598 [Symbiodinium microadriaticum]|uniref:Uncharacterized protein n=1 Tax=Symbiodinium microadriaticum TaxID=2951 RepID=A0A1Q9CB42_SYMMI|nr:hypothetical protein AK812_SmicGene39598 [Symbiodinium microadriaticum]